MGQSRPLFVYFCSFLITISIQIEKSIDGVLGIWTRGRAMVGTDKTMELWRPTPVLGFFASSSPNNIFVTNSRILNMPPAKQNGETFL